MAEVDPKRLVFLDESGIDTRLTRRHARAAKGKRALGKAPWGHWKRLTVLGALAREGVVACMSVAAATSTAVFEAFVEQVLAPALRDRPDAIVVMDNLAAHKAKTVQKALDAAEIAYRYLPAYSPDLNPIEPCWAKLKTRLRAKAAGTLDALEAELGPALAAITAQDAQGWFRLCGYPPSQLNPHPLYSLFSARTGAPLARLRPTGEAGKVRVLWWNGERWGASGPFGIVTMPLDYIATEPAFWIHA